MRKFLMLILWLAMTATAYGQNASAAPLESTDLVQRALAAELRAAQDSSHPMRYRLHRTSVHENITREIIETKDGGVARLVSVNDQPPSAEDVRKDDAKLDGLLSDPGKQRHRRQSEEEDRGRALKVLRALPVAYVYRYIGTVPVGSGYAERFIFTPNPNYDPPDLETQVLTAMNGEIWIDPAQVRVVHLQARLQKDVDFGWGVLGRLYKGGWLTVDQADVGGGVWRVTKLQLSMTARILIRTRSFQTNEDETQFAPVPADLDYRQAIALLRAKPEAPEAKPEEPRR